MPTGQGKVKEIRYFRQGQGNVGEFHKMVSEIRTSLKVRECFLQPIGNLTNRYEMMTVNVFG